MILQDIIPDIVEENDTPMKQIHYEDSEGKLTIPLSNGNVMKIPKTSINISEEVNRSGIWQQVNANGKEKKKSPKM